MESGARMVESDLTNGNQGITEHRLRSIVGDYWWHSQWVPKLQGLVLGAPKLMQSGVVSGKCPLGVYPMHYWCDEDLLSKENRKYTMWSK